MLNYQHQRGKTCPFVFIPNYFPQCISTKVKQRLKQYCNVQILNDNLENHNSIKKYLSLIYMVTMLRVSMWVFLTFIYNSLPLLHMFLI